MKCSKTVYSKGKKRKSMEQKKGNKFENKIRKYLSETDKGSYYSQIKQLEEYENQKLYYSEALDGSCSLISENASDTSYEESHSSDEGYQGDEFRKRKDVDATKN